MNEIGTIVVGESLRFGQIVSTLVVGDLDGSSLVELQGELRQLGSVDEIITMAASGVSADLVVAIADGTVNRGCRLRTLGRALAAVSSCGVILITQCKEIIPVPLIELKRGLLIERPDLCYRVYGKR